MTHFFIIGAPRSGTTMLQLALNRHTRVIIPPETAYFTMVERSFRGQLIHRRRIEKDLKIKLPPVKGRLHRKDEIRQDYLRMIESYAQAIRRPFVSHFGEKSPEHTRRVQKIMATFPDSKLIILYRDGRDVASSLSRVEWMPNDLEIGFALWLYYHKICRDILRSYPNQALRVRYEDLVADPSNELARILHFLGLESEYDVARGSGNREGVVEHELSYKSRAFDPISTTRVSAWKTELTNSQITLLESWGGQELQDLGYELWTNPSRLPRPVRVPWIYVRAAIWLLRRHLAQKSDEWLGTCYNPANWTLRSP